MKGISTESIHEGEEPEETQYGDVVSPIHLSTTFAKRDMDKIDQGYVYTRTSNPTRDKLEKKLAVLEKGNYGTAFSSGMAAETIVLLSLLKEGDHILAMDDLYGGTKRLFEQVMRRFGLDFDYIDMREVDNIESEIKENTEMIWIESPTNPLMKLVNIEKVSELAHEKDITVVTDNTFASPVFQKPLVYGSDIVVHSLTKYLGGHSDVIGGAIIANEKELFEQIKFHQNAVGAILSPFDSWVVMRGIKTLKVRMKKHEENAMKVAKYLKGHDTVKDVYYPGLRTHPQHELAREQMDGYGGMLSFELKGNKQESVKFVENLDIFVLAESLGGVESLIEIPALMTHGSVPKEEREEIGLTDSLIRVSVGIEEAEDLINDFEKGFKTIGK